MDATKTLRVAARDWRRLRTIAFDFISSAPVRRLRVGRGRPVRRQCAGIPFRRQLPLRSLLDAENRRVFLCTHCATMTPCFVFLRALLRHFGKFRRPNQLGNDHAHLPAF